MGFCAEEGSGVFDFVPNEIIVKILSYVSVKELILSVRLVCRGWFYLSRESSLWTTLTSKDFEDLRLFSLPRLQYFLFRNKDFLALKRLFLDRCDEVTEEYLRILPSFLPSLCELSLAFCSQVNQSVLKQFSKNCLLIRTLNLENCEITDDCLSLFHGQEITKLNLSHCNSLTDQSIVEASRSWNIKNLNIDGVQWISDKAVENLLDYCKHSLEQLWLDGENLTDEALARLTHCCNIRVLKVTYCEQLTDVTLHNISEMPSLTSLCLRKGKNFSKDGLIFMLQNLKCGFRAVDFTDCQAFNDEAVYWLTKLSRNLTSLNLSWCWLITDEGLKFIVNRCHNIKVLTLTGLHVLTGIPLKETSQKLPRLKYLDLTNCNSVIDNILTDLARQIDTLDIMDYYGNLVK